MDYLNNISDEELYKSLLGFGMFSEKLPPVFTSESFADYCIQNTPRFLDKKKQYVYYENMRNINVPRPLGIPAPMVYQKLVRFMADNWDQLRTYFEESNKDQVVKVSRIHIRKIKNKSKIFNDSYGDEDEEDEENADTEYRDKLFEMNQNDWREDGSPEDKLIFGKKYVVRADIAKCFPSIYTHSLSWALAGKEVAKQTQRNKTLWYNQIDHLTQLNKDLETHGLIIGPHASNVLSEIILCRVDKELVRAGWEYFRNIDDYTCYVEDEGQAGKFLTELQAELRKYDLSLNHKKTEIKRLPEAMVESWVRKIKGMQLLTQYGKVDYKNCRTYLDFAIDIFKKEKENAAVLTFAIKILSGITLTENAKEYEKNMIFHLCLSYPYLVVLMEKYVFGPCEVSTDEIKKLAEKLYENGLKNQMFEQSSYAIYFAIRYGFELEVDYAKLIGTEDCVLLTLGYMYFSKHAEHNAIKE